MQTKQRKLGNMTVEETLLDEEGQAKQRVLNEAALMEYTKTRRLGSQELREKVEQYDTEIIEHVID